MQADLSIELYLLTAPVGLADRCLLADSIAKLHQANEARGRLEALLEQHLCGTHLTDCANC